MSTEIPQMVRSLYIGVEGIDGSGKSEVAKRVAAELQAHLTREPGGSPLAEAVRDLLLKGDGMRDPLVEFSLFWASRFALLSRVVIPTLATGKHVVSDRTDASTFAYQMHAERLGESVRGTRHLFWALRDCMPRRPDLYIYLDVPLDVAAERRAKSERRHQTNHFDDRPPEFFKALQKGYEKFFAMVEDKFVRIDARHSLDDVVHAAVVAARSHQPALL